MMAPTFKRAFTMLELIFVIVILGIVSSIGSSLIANVYESYINQKALHNATTKTDLAVKQIAARLTFRVNQSVIGKKLDGTYLAISQITPGDQYRILEWIGYDNDSLSAKNKNGWSGFCDITASTKSRLSTPGSKLNKTKKIIENLGGVITDAVVIFNAEYYSESGTVKRYTPQTMGFDGLAAATTISPVTGLAGGTGKTIIKVSDSSVEKTLYDQYKLAWSAYAIVPEQQIDDANTTVDESKLFNLKLYYNYQPWKGDTYADGSSSMLVEDVNVFKFQGIGNTLRFKICVQEKISSSETVNICKEKAVIR